MVTWLLVEMKLNFETKMIVKFRNKMLILFHFRVNHPIVPAVPDLAYATDDGLRYGESFRFAVQVYKSVRGAGGTSVTVQHVLSTREYAISWHFWRTDLVYVIWGLPCFA